MQIIYFLKVISPSSIPLYLLLCWGMYILCYCVISMYCCNSFSDVLLQLVVIPWWLMYT